MPETEAATRTAGDLSGTDIGTTVTVSTLAWVIVGRLYEVDHEGTQAEVSTGHHGEPHGYFLATRWVNLTIGPWSGEVPPDAVVSTA